MIAVHRLTHPECPLWLNPDLIQQIDADAGHVVSCSTNGTRLVVHEEPEQILELRARVARDASSRSPRSRTCSRRARQV